uniref:Uncharacterized protein n=1 Tax=Glossina austeni TaxID=7395 RepID=A0A1A9VNR9_GLOAU
MLERIMRRRKQRSVGFAVQNNKQQNWPKEAYTRNYKCCLRANKCRKAVFSNQASTQSENRFNRVLPGDVLTVGEIQATCQASKKKKAPGPDSTPNEVIQLVVSIGRVYSSGHVIEARQAFR